MPVIIAIANNEFPRLLELDQCIPNLFNGSQSGRDILILKVNTQNIGVFCSVFYCLKNIVQPKAGSRFHAKVIEPLKGIL